VGAEVKRFRCDERVWCKQITVPIETERFIADQCDQLVILSGVDLAANSDSRRNPVGHGQLPFFPQATRRTAMMRAD
jgi:hypothetical protein